MAEERPKSSFESLMDKLRKHEQITAVQKASGDPVLTCGYCSGDTRFRESAQRFLIECERCGAYTIGTRLTDGRLSISAICAGPRERSIGKR